MNFIYTLLSGGMFECMNVDIEPYEICTEDAHSYFVHFCAIVSEK